MLTSAGLLELEDARWQAIIAADVSRLRDLLSDDLVYLHSTGQRDDKSSYLALIADGPARYRSSERSAPLISIRHDAAVIAGDVHVGAEVDGNAIEVYMRYSAVWTLEDDAWRMLSWHASTAPAPS